MDARYLVVKHMPDVRLREPRNVGIIVRVGEQVALKFVGQGDDGRIDGRRARAVKAPLDIYESWVDYFTRRANEGAWEELATPRSRRPRTFYVEHGGQWLDPVVNAATLADRLFPEYVRGGREPSVREITLRGKVRAILDGAGLADAEESVTVAAQFGEAAELVDVPFGWRYVNGQPHLMEEVSVRDSRADASAREVWARMQGARLAGSAQSFVAFYASTDAVSDERLGAVLHTLERQARTVDVDHEDEAVDTLRTLMAHA